MIRRYVRKIVNSENGVRLSNNAFTLIELLGVLIILAIIALITIPIIDKSLENSRQAAYARAVDNIINAARNYSVSNDLGYSTKRLPLFVSKLQDEGFLTLDIKSPIDESEMGGCVWYYWDESHKQYIFEYDNICTIEEPSIDITYNADLINSNGWANENIAATLVGTGDIKYCISSSQCEPTEEIINGSNTKFITNEGTSYICASSTNVLGESTSLCRNFKIDKTAPTIDGLELITVDKDGSVDLKTGVTVDDNLSGIDGTYTINPNTVDTSTAGNKNVIYSVSDIAGNTTTKARTVKVVSEPPVIVFNVEGNPFNSNNWSKENVTVKINVTDNSGLGIKEIKYCKGTTDCEPTTSIENNGTVTLEESSATNKVCVIATDNNNTSSKICSNNYQIDKVLPTIDGIGDIKVNRNDNVNLTSGVTYSDALSQIDGELTITPSTVDTSTIGTKQVTYRVVDKAGNVREVTRNIIVDAEAPTIVFNLVNNSAINSNGWAKSDFYLRATITDNSGTGIASGSSCTTNSSSECTPIASFTGTTKDFLISVEGSNRACVQVTDNNNKTTKVCSNTYNLDKTAPTAGTATFSGTLGSNSWYTSNVTVNKVNGSDALSGHSSTTSNISSITSNTTGTTVTITTTDLAGNSATRNYTIKVDKNAPSTASLSVSSSTSNSITVTASGADSTSGIYSYTFQRSTTSSTSGFTTVATRTTTSTSYSYTYTGLSSGPTYYLRVIATDAAGNTKTSSVVSRTLNVPPTIASVSVSNKTTNSITIAARSTDSDGDRLTYKLYTGPSSNNLTLATTSSSTTSGTQVSLRKSSLNQYTTYYYRVDVSDGITTTTGNVGSVRTYCPGTGLTCSGQNLYCSGSLRTCNSQNYYCSGGTSSSRRCTRCNGTGTTKCSGSMVYQDYGGMQRCPSCGQNTLRMEAFMCHTCGLRDVLACGVCSNCGYKQDQSTPAHPATGGRCSTCGGTGYITTSSSCRHGYTSPHYYCSHGYTYSHSYYSTCAHGVTGPHYYCNHGYTYSHSYCSHGYTYQHD